MATYWRPLAAAPLRDDLKLARRRLLQWTSTLRRIIGAPDYAAYVAHRKSFHPDCEILTEDEFIRQRLEDRYARPGSRCC